MRRVGLGWVGVTELKQLRRIRQGNWSKMLVVVVGAGLQRKQAPLLQNTPKITAVVSRHKNTATPSSWATITEQLSKICQAETPQAVAPAHRFTTEPHV